VPVCDTTVHLPWLVQAVRAHGGTFVTRTIGSLAEALAEARSVVNCTGLGAAALCNDRELRPVRGQVVLVERVALPHALIDDASEQPFYAIPRRDDVVLGGTAQPGDLRTEPDDADTASVLAGMAQRLPVLRGAKVRAVRVGLRPARSTVRLELEPAAGGRLVHNYGHGGSGYTLAWGCAEEVVRLLEASVG
jgi:D-amino-acid oxidase